MGPLVSIDLGMDEGVNSLPTPPYVPLANNKDIIHTERDNELKKMEEEAEKIKSIKPKQRTGDHKI